jgi:ATP-binding cassette subfamily C protein LapB
MKNDAPGADLSAQPALNEQALTPARKVDDTLLKSLIWMAAHHGKPVSEAALIAGLPAGRFMLPKQAQIAMEQAGFAAGVVERLVHEVSPMLLPVILFRKDHGGCILLGTAPDKVKVQKSQADAKGRTEDEYETAYRLILPEVGPQVVTMGASKVKEFYTGFAMLVKPLAKVDARAGVPSDDGNGHQLQSGLGDVARKSYGGIAAATALTMIPDVDANKTLSVGIVGGTYRGYAATAIGGTARITQNLKVRVGAGRSSSGTTVGAGASYQW